jgi:hypothetical protein
VPSGPPKLYPRSRGGLSIATASAKIHSSSGVGSNFFCRMTGERITITDLRRQRVPKRSVATYTRSTSSAKTEVPRGGPMDRCSSCGIDLPGHEELCQKCARYGVLAAPQDSFRHWTTYIYLPLWISVSYVLVTYMPTSAAVGLLLAGLVVIGYLFFWAYSQRPRKRYRTPQETFCLVLGLCLGVVWKITGAQAWERLAIGCIFVAGGYRAVYRLIDRIKMASGGPSSRES